MKPIIFIADASLMLFEVFKRAILYDVVFRCTRQSEVDDEQMRRKQRHQLQRHSLDKYRHQEQMPTVE